MQHPHTLDLTRSALVIIDMQEAFRTKIPDFNATAKQIELMIRGAKLLQLPILVTEQYPRGLGHTAAEIQQALPEDVVISEKASFSSCGATAFEAQLERSGARQVLVAGIEAHICISQTVHDLLARSLQVHLLVDCVTARDSRNKDLAVTKMQLSGALPSSVEMALFELMRDARHAQFRAVQALLK